MTKLMAYSDLFLLLGILLTVVLMFILVLKNINKHFTKRDNYV